MDAHSQTDNRFLLLPSNPFHSRGPSKANQVSHRVGEEQGEVTADFPLGLFSCMSGFRAIMAIDPFD